MPDPVSQILRQSGCLTKGRLCGAEDSQQPDGGDLAWQGDQGPGSGKEKEKNQE